MSTLTITVHGTPAPKGSSRAIKRGNRAVLVPGCSNVNLRKVQAWSAQVAAAARNALVGDFGWTSCAPAFRNAALTVVVVFYMARPIGHYGARGIRPSAPVYPSVKPDVDKLARSTLDALTGIVWDDDSRIVHLTVAKMYAQRPVDEGAWIAVRERRVGDTDAAHAEVQP